MDDNDTSSTSKLTSVTSEITSNWEIYFYDAFNEAYQSYLNNISPNVFMNIYLERIIKITGSKTGFIASINQMNEKRYMSLEAISNNFFVYDEMSVPSDLLLDIDEYDCVYTFAAKQKQVIIENDIRSCHIDSSFKSYININTCVCVPYSFNDKIIGVITLANKSSYDDEIIPHLKILGTLTAVLQNNYFKRKKTSLETDNRFMTYQLFEHMLNYIRDGTIVITNNFSIVYINQHAINIIDMINNSDNFVSSIRRCHNYMNTDILKIFPQLNILNNKNNSEISSTNHKLFKNRRISTRIDNNRALMCPFVMEFIVNSVICHNQIYHIIMIYNNTDNVAYEHKNQTNFIAYLSHELRNPLQSINFANYLLQCNLKNFLNNINTDHFTSENCSYLDIKDSTKISSYLNTIARSCCEMKKIINDILDLSKIEAREFIIELDVCEIKELVETIIAEFFPSAQEKNMILSLEINDDVPKTIYTDEVRISQILSNLISNAIKFGKSGEIKLSISYDEFDHGIKFSVIDHGEGIKKEEIPNLFKQFCRTSSSDKFNSNGLGLYVSQQIAHLLGGHICVVSEHKKGSTFTLFHPIKLGSSGTFLDKNKYNKCLSGNILIIDDNESNLTLFKLILDHFNCEYKYYLETNTVTSGIDAINLCNVNKYDIIFMDINMLGIDGCTASKIIKLNNKNEFSGKIIATTGNILAKKENSSLCNDQEKYKYFDDVIIKPYDDSLILKILHRYL